jgi:hypothetical protein
VKPLCPDCGDRHEKYQAHVWKKVANKPVANAVANKFSDFIRLATPAEKEKVYAEVMDKAVKRQGRYKDLEKRKAYMREYMRRRRGGN